jgi:hypothetical protein
MKRKKKSDAEQTGSSTPFFARYLEGQDSKTIGSAKVGGRAGIAQKDAKAAKQSWKYPSDRDEVDWFPYYPSAADVPKEPGSKLVTLKYPSDSDEETWLAEYLSAEDVPAKNIKTKAAKVQLKKKK